jgi:hypothetical protein
MARSKRTKIEFNFENKEGKEITLDASGYVSPFVPARIHPVDHSHDAEGGEVEDIELIHNGVELDLDDAIEMGLDQSKLEEAIYEEACNQDPDYNED